MANTMNGGDPEATTRWGPQPDPAGSEQHLTTPREYDAKTQRLMEDLRGHGERLDKFTAALNAWAEQARCGIARHMDRQIADIICAPAPTPRFDVDKRLAEITPPCDDCAAPDSMTYPQGCDQCSRTPEQREAHRRK